MPSAVTFYDKNEIGFGPTHTSVLDPSASNSRGAQACFFRRLLNDAGHETYNTSSRGVPRPILVLATGKAPAIHRACGESAIG